MYMGRRGDDPRADARGGRPRSLGVQGCGASGCGVISLSLYIYIYTYN